MTHYELKGKVTYVTKDFFKVDTVQGVYEIHHKMQFLPIKYGDLIDGSVHSVNEKFYLDPDPEIVIPTDDLCVNGCLKAVMGKYADNKIIYAIVSTFRRAAKGEELVAYINRVTQEYVRDRKESLVSMFSFPDSETLMPKFYRWWFDNRCLRRLYLIGITKTEIRRSGFAPVEFFEQAKQNPFAVASLPLEKCKKISDKLHRAWTEDEVRAGEILRFLIEENAKRSDHYMRATVLRSRFAFLDESRSLLEKEYQLIFDEDRVYRRSDYEAEKNVSKFIKRAVRSEKLELGEVSLTGLSEDQESAVRGALLESCAIIKGGPGTGKTTLGRELIRSYQDLHWSFLVGAFTGISVSRIRKKTGYHKAKTLHRLIRERHMKKELRQVKETRELTEKERDIEESEEPTHLLIDEGGMVTLTLLADLLKSYPTIKTLHIIGDEDQLDPIGSGSLFAQLLASLRVPVFRLTTNFRMKLPDDQLNGVLATAKAMVDHRAGSDFSLIAGSNLWIQQGSFETIKQLIQGYHERGCRAGTDFIFLTPYNRDVDLINQESQKLFGHHQDSVIDAQGQRWCVGDPVMMTENDSEIEVFNGEIGKVIEIRRTENLLWVAFGDGRVHEFLLQPTQKDSFSVFEDDEEVSYERTVRKLRLAYALTVHKSQGSEWPYVVFYLPPGARPGRFLNKKLFYTAITRCQSSLLIVYGDGNVLIRAATTLPPKRNDHLAKRLGVLPALYEEQVHEEPFSEEMYLEEEWYDDDE